MIKRVLAGLGLLVAVGGAGPAAVGQCVLDWADGFAAPGMDEPVHALAVFDDGNARSAAVLSTTIRRRDTDVPVRVGSEASGK